MKRQTIEKINKLMISNLATQQRANPNLTAKQAKRYTQNLKAFLRKNLPRPLKQLAQQQLRKYQAGA